MRSDGSVLRVTHEDILPRVRDILVLGATGGTGIELLKQALALNYHVIAIVRNESKLSSRLKRTPNLVLIRGQIDSIEDLNKAMETRPDVVVCVYGPTLFQDKYATTICSRAQTVVQESMRYYNVRRLIVVTSQGVKGSEAAITPIRHSLFARHFLFPVMQDKELQEKIILAEAEHFDYTIFRSGRLNNGCLVGEHVISADPIKEGRISRSDLAKVILDEIKLCNYVNQAPTVVVAAKAQRLKYKRSGSVNMVDSKMFGLGRSLRGEEIKKAASTVSSVNDGCSQK